MDQSILTPFFKAFPTDSLFSVFYIKNQVPNVPLTGRL